MTLAIGLKARYYPHIAVEHVDVKVFLLLLNSLVEPRTPGDVKVRIEKAVVWKGSFLEYSPNFECKELELSHDDLVRISGIRTLAAGVASKLSSGRWDGVKTYAVLEFDGYSIPFSAVCIRSFFVRKRMYLVRAKVGPHILLMFPEVEIEGRVLYGLKDLIEYHTGIREFVYSVLESFFRKCSVMRTRASAGTVIGRLISYVDIANGVEYVKLPHLSLPVHRRRLGELVRDIVFSFKALPKESVPEVYSSNPGHLFDKLNNALAHFKEKFVLNTMEGTKFSKLLTSLLLTKFDLRYNFTRRAKELKELSFSTEHIVLYPRNTRYDPPAEDIRYIVTKVLTVLGEVSEAIEKVEVRGLSKRTVMKTLKEIFNNVKA